MNVNIDKADIASVKKMLTGIKNGTPKALTQALNKTTKTMKTQIKARLGNELNLTAARIEKDLRIIKASYNNLNGGVVASGQPVGLTQFKATQTKKGVKVKTKKAGTKKLIKHAFIQHGRNQNLHVFWRKGKERYEIHAKHGPRIEDILASPKVLEPIQIQAAHIFPQNVLKAVDDILKRFG